MNNNWSDYSCCIRTIKLTSPIYNANKKNYSESFKHLKTKKNAYRNSLDLIFLLRYYILSDYMII